MFNERLERLLKVGDKVSFDVKRQEKVSISSIGVKGFKSFENFETNLTNFNVIGGEMNSGKSNFLSLFSFVGNIFSGKLQEYVAYSGGADEILYQGVHRTREITINIAADVGGSPFEYQATLMFAKPNRLVFKEELVKTNRDWRTIGGSSEESVLIESTNNTEKLFVNSLKQMRVYQFTNVSERSHSRLHWPENDGFILKLNAQNLGSFLYNLKNTELNFYNNLVNMIKLIIPNFQDFELNSENNLVLLRWKETSSNKIFSSFQASDNTLRLFSTFGFLLQNPRKLPPIVIIDDIDCGLNNKSVKVLTDILNTISNDVQVIVSSERISNTITVGQKGGKLNTISQRERNTEDNVFNVISSPRRMVRSKVRDFNEHMEIIHRYIRFEDYDRLRDYIAEHIKVWTDTFTDSEFEEFTKIVNSNKKLFRIISELRG